MPLARGSVIPEIASTREDFPALCQPMTTIAGISRSTSALRHGFMIADEEPEQRDAPNGTHTSKELEHALPSGSILRV